MGQESQLGLSFLLTVALLTAPALSANLPVAPAFAVPVLCTDSPSARTKVRGTAIVLDASGMIVTAAHVILESPPSCVLTVIVPNDDWSRARGFHPFAVQRCSSNDLLDLALCHIQPIESSRDWSFVRAAPLSTRPPTPNSAVTITGFTGWGFLPTVISSHVLSPAQLYRRQDGCYCDFAIDFAAHAGMSGSPILTSDGDVVGVLTTAGTGKFRGISFGTSMERADSFLRRAGLNSLAASHMMGHR